MRHLYLIPVHFLLAVCLYGTPAAAASDALLIDSIRCHRSAGANLCVDLSSSVAANLRIEKDARLHREFAETGAAMARIFSASVSEIPTVVLLSPERLPEITSAPSWASALYQEETIFIAVNFRKPLKRKRIVQAFRHEMVHVHVAELSQGRCPAWFDEGLAMYLSGDSARLRKRSLSKAANSPIVFDDKSRSFLNMEKADARQAYLKVDEMIRSLVFRKGFASIRTYLIALGYGSDPVVEYRRVFGEALPDVSAALGN